MLEAFDMSRDAIDWLIDLVWSTSWIGKITVACTGISSVRVAISVGGWIIIKTLGGILMLQKCKKETCQTIVF